MLRQEKLHQLSVDMRKNKTKDSVFYYNNKDINSAKSMQLSSNNKLSHENIKRSFAKP